MHSHNRLPPRLATPLGKAYTVSVEWFFKHVLPPLPSHIDLDALINEGAFRQAVTSNHKLWGYGAKNPSGHHRKDVKKSYRYLQRSIHTILRAAHNANPPLVFRNNKECVSRFNKRTSGCKPDAYFLREWNSSGPVAWTDIAVLGEYMCEYTDETARENIDKISASIFNCIRHDPRRRFIYAFTVDDTFMKLWYCDRSQIVVSDPFDFVENHRTLMRFILCLSFAQPHQLGWDPSVRQLVVNGQVQYEIKVQPKTGEPSVYRTLRVLSDSGAKRGVLGRGTRVWEAIKLVDGLQTGLPVALKDSWVDDEREREGDIYTRLSQSDSFQSHPGSDKFFITVLTHGDVLVADALDRTPTLRLSSEGGATKAYPTLQVHYRIVYKEIGEPLADVSSLHTVFKILQDVTRGLKVMHSSGWVHRDLSVGNVLIVDGAGRITDLEYATNTIEHQESGGIGTASFIAAEVNFREYLFLPEPKEDTPSDDIEVDLYALNSSESGSIPPKPTPEPIELACPQHKVLYNPLHDMESLWWMAVYFIVKREVDIDQEDAHNCYAEEPYPSRIFDPEELFHDGVSRRLALTTTNYFTDTLSNLHHSLRGVVSILNELRIVLCRAYASAEKAIDAIGPSVASSTYNRFLARLAKAMEITKTIKIRELGTATSMHYTSD